MLSRFFSTNSQNNNEEDKNKNNPFLGLPRDVHLYMQSFLGKKDLFQLSRVAKKSHELSEKSIVEEKIKYIQKILSNRDRYSCFTKEQVQFFIDFLIENDKSALAYQLLQNMITTDRKSCGLDLHSLAWIKILESNFQLAGFIHHRFLTVAFDSKDLEEINFESAIILICCKKILENNLDQKSVDLINAYYKDKDFSHSMLNITDGKAYIDGKLIDDLVDQLLTTMKKPLSINLGYGNKIDVIFPREIYEGWQYTFGRDAYVDGFTLEIAKQKVNTFADKMLVNIYPNLNKKSCVIM